MMWRGSDIGAQRSRGVPLAAQADNGVVVEQDVSTDTESMYLDGDLENSSSADGTNTVGITAEVTVTAETVLTLEASNKWIEPAGKLTLRAGAGVVVGLR